MRKIEEKQMQDYKQSEYGVTLIELIVVVSLIGIMTVIAITGFDYITRQRVSSATAELVADIQQKRVEALTANQSGSTSMGSGIRFVPPTSYVLFTWNDNNTDFAYSGVSEEASVATRTIPSNLSLQISASPGDPLYSVLIYNKMGVPIRYKADGSSIAGDLVLVISDGTANNAKCITVGTNSIWGGILSGTTCVRQ
jgi:prepilin-type N-terminal cleavage/methylation domain-containing protein